MELTIHTVSKKYSHSRDKRQHPRKTKQKGLRTRCEKAWQGCMIPVGSGPVVPSLRGETFTSEWEYLLPPLPRL